MMIANGATLRLVATGAIRSGTNDALITARAGITGSFTTIQKPDSLFGFVVQRADRYDLDSWISEVSVHYALTTSD